MNFITGKGIVTGLMALVFVALFMILVVPQLQSMSDARRISDVRAMSEAISLYLKEGNTLSCIPGKVYRSFDKGNRIDGTGWVPIDFRKISSGSPLKRLPFDPYTSESLAEPVYFYTFACDLVHNTYELNARFEGKKFRKDAEQDGGNNPNVYEIGNDLTLIR